MWWILNIFGSHIVWWSHYFKVKTEARNFFFFSRWKSLIKCMLDVEIAWKSSQKHDIYFCITFTCWIERINRNIHDEVSYSPLSSLSGVASPPIIQVWAALWVHGNPGYVGQVCPSLPPGILRICITIWHHHLTHVPASCQILSDLQTQHAASKCPPS